MKRALVVMVVLSVLVLGSAVAAFALASPRMKVDVPFAFYVDKNLLPAGQYVVEIRTAGFGSAMVLRNREGSVNQFLPISWAGNAQKDTAYSLIFSQYGETRFLARVHQGSYEAGMARTPAERELARADAKVPGRKAPEQVKIAAAWE